MTNPSVKSKQQLTKCVNCSQHFDARRRSVGDPFRCRLCGHKHTHDEVCENRPTELLQRLKRLLSGESKGRVDGKITSLSLGDGRDVSGGNKRIYIMESEGDLFKIGISKNPAKRLISVKSSNSKDVALRASYDIDDTRAVEKELHNRFEDKKVSGEWFDMNYETIEKLEDELQQRESGNSVQGVATCGRSRTNNPWRCFQRMTHTNQSDGYTSNDISGIDCTDDSHTVESTHTMEVRR